MTIWILALVLLASLAGMGYRQGAIRVLASLCGIVLGAVCAPFLAGLIRPVLSLVGVKNPLLLWSVPPLIMFLIVLIAFKVVGLMFHKKTELHFKYAVGDLRLALWERLNRRVGLCLGLFNGTAYLVLV